MKSLLGDTDSEGDIDSNEEDENDSNAEVIESDPSVN